MKHSEVSTADIKGKIDFGIITIREDEFEAVLQRFPTEFLVRGKQTYAVSRLKTTNDDEYLIASVRCPEQGNAQGQTVANNLIEELDPQWILVAGIAGSIPDTEHTLGDVILATRLHDFCVSANIERETQKVIQQFDVRGGAMHPAVQSLIAALPAIAPFLESWNTPAKLTVQRPEVKFSAKNFYGDDRWKKKVRESLKLYFGNQSTRQNPKVFTGAIASSDVLVKNTQLVQQWLDTARQIRGIEMELAGIYQAAWSSQKPVLAIRGISDVVGFKRSPEWTSYACHAAASFTAALLRYRPITPRSSQNLSVAESEGKEQDSNSSSSLQNRPVSVFKNPPPNITSLSKSETLYSNLLEVLYFPDKLYSVRTDCKTAGEVWGILKNETDNPPGDWIYKGKTIYSFDNFNDSVWQNVYDVNTVEEHPTSHWSDSTNHNRLAEFIELLKRCLRRFAQALDLYYIDRQWVRKVKRTFKYLYYAPTPDLSTRRVVERSLVQSRPREVFKAYYSKKTGKLSYYRHMAFRFEFLRFENHWYLEITPTYHYTWNGYRVSFFYEDLVKGIKRIEKNEAVFRQVLFWATVLQGNKSEFLEQQKYPFLQFGKLLDFQFFYGVRDEIWINKESLGKKNNLSKKKNKSSSKKKANNYESLSVTGHLFN